jgi:hypothetical protein
MGKAEVFLAFGQHQNDATGKAGSREVTLAEMFRLERHRSKKPTPFKGGSMSQRYWRTKIAHACIL